MGKHLPGIDGLRAFAVLSVVAYHAGLPLAAGYVGVDVFFVISGYVITRMLLAEPTIDLAAFYARRVRRILPALLVVVGTVLAVSTALLSADIQENVNSTAVAAMAMVGNVWFQVHTGGYFDAATDEMPLLHLWSLGVEEQFYLLWPLLLMQRKPWFLAVLAAASFGFAQYWVGANPEVAFYQMPARFWELAVGGLLAFAPKSRIGTWTAWVGLPLLAISVLTMPREFPGVGAVLPVLGSAMVLYAIHCGVRVRPLDLAPVRYIGLVSYGFYLWHWPLLAMWRGYSFEPPTLTQNLALCGLAFVLACLSYHLIELPFRRTNPPKVRAIALGVTACLALAGCAAVVGTTTPQYAEEVKVALHVPVKGCFLSRHDAPMLSAECGDGDVVLWGDSHAYMWRPYADRFGSVVTATRSGCPPSVGVVKDDEDRCGAFGKVALERAKKARVVVLAAHWAARDGTAGMKDVLDALGDRQVVVMGPLPQMPYLPPKCVLKHQIDKCQITRAEFERRAAPLRKALQEAIAGHPNATLVDPTDFFCTDVCPLMKDGYLLYRDLDHITAKAASGYATMASTLVRMADESAL